MNMYLSILACVSVLFGFLVAPVHGVSCYKTYNGYLMGSTMNNCNYCTTSLIYYTDTFTYRTTLSCEQYCIPGVGVSCCNTANLCNAVGFTCYTSTFGQTEKGCSYCTKAVTKSSDGSTSGELDCIKGAVTDCQESIKTDENGDPVQTTCCRSNLCNFFLATSAPATYTCYVQSTGIVTTTNTKAECNWCQIANQTNYITQSCVDSCTEFNDGIDKVSCCQSDKCNTLYFLENLAFNIQPSITVWVVAAIATLVVGMHISL